VAWLVSSSSSSFVVMLAFAVGTVFTHLAGSSINSSSSNLGSG
jgi:hypothetical protein